MENNEQVSNFSEFLLRLEQVLVFGMAKDTLI